MIYFVCRNETCSELDVMKPGWPYPNPPVCTCGNCGDICENVEGPDPEVTNANPAN